MSVLLAGLLVAGVTSGFLFAQPLQLDYSIYLGGSDPDQGGALGDPRRDPGLFRKGRGQSGESVIGDPGDADCRLDR